MGNGSLESRVTKLEKTTGGCESGVDIYLRTCSPELRALLSGHEAELAGYVFADGGLTFEGLQIIYGYLPEKFQRAR
jgi:hypothetical protein